MSTTDVFDARNGLTRELIEELRSAQLVVLGLRDEWTAVAHIEFDQGQRARHIILPAVVHVTHGSRLSAQVAPGCAGIHSAIRPCQAGGESANQCGSAA